MSSAHEPRRTYLQHLSVAGTPPGGHGPRRRPLPRVRRPCHGRRDQPPAGCDRGSPRPMLRSVDERAARRRPTRLIARSAERRGCVARMVAA
jgi:hypothetical protein